MTSTTQKGKRNRLIDYGQVLAVEHGVHPSLVPQAVDRVLDWHSSKQELADEEMLQQCLDDVLAAEDSAVDAIVPIDLFNQPGPPWGNKASDQLARSIIEQGYAAECVRVCRFLSNVHVHFRLSGSADEARAEAIEVVQAAIAGSGKKVMEQYVEAKVVLPESPPAFCV